VIDLDGNGLPEIWFASSAGGLWCIDATQARGLARVVQVKGELGPIAAAAATSMGPAALLVGTGRLVLRLTKGPGLTASPRDRHDRS
jgi:hypothetical protein